jgi:transcriptional regulator of arginine metabolism
MTNINDIGAARRRREDIAELVGRRPVRSQDELVRLLRARGWRVTQPTLSRDLRALGLAKTPAGYVLPGAMGGAGAPRAADLGRALAEFGRSATVAGTLVVVKTVPAGADPVARALDEAGLEGVVGTIAGEDTVFVATPSAAAAGRLRERLHGALPAPQRARQRA